MQWTMENCYRFVTNTPWISQTFMQHLCQEGAKGALEGHQMNADIAITLSLALGALIGFGFGYGKGFEHGKIKGRIAARKVARQLEQVGR